MRIPSLLIAVALAACVTNPDPRHPSMTDVQRTGFGGWIVIELPDGSKIDGELISIDTAAIHVLRINGDLVAVPPGRVASADLFTYVSEGSYAAWGALGALSTLSHGYFLFISFPVWVLSASLTANAESRHVIVSYPDDGWTKMAEWARFPQGLPPDVRDVREFLRRRAGAAAMEPGPGPGSTPRPRPTEEAVLKRAQAWKLTKRAADAARSGDCAQVRELAPVIAELDPEFHATVFGRDAAIARCVAAPAP